MSDFKVESFFLNEEVIKEELTDGEIDSLEADNSLVDQQLNIYVVKSVHRNEHGDVVFVKLRAYETPEAEGVDGDELTIKLTQKELKKFDLS